MLAQLRMIIRRFRARYVFGLSLLASAIRVGIYLSSTLPTPVTVGLILTDVTITSITGEQLIRMDHFDQDKPGHVVASVG
jgi:uncharacterized oligopeptide transporter (OPT) family protein